MIQLKRYPEEFEREYWEAVNKKVESSIQKKIIESCKKFLPTDFFTGNEDEFFKLLILAPFEKLKNAEAHITNKKVKVMENECFHKKQKKRPRFKKMYQVIHDSYTSLASSQVKRESMRVRLVKNAGLSVCPYCNRDYINCRGESVSGAQLDHFFSKSEFPLFAVCLYNLVPVCGNCNRVKSAKPIVFVSPFDNSINWDEDIIFTYKGSTINDIKVNIITKGNLENNMKGMRINSAYQIHSLEIIELIEKAQMYNGTQKEEFKKVLGPDNITDKEIKKLIFGPEVTNDCMRTKPLGKMMHDLHKELRIYN
jgi:5-methylcytosine-specific restriction endonuclease McrA